MRLDHLTLHGFRNHLSSTFDFGDGANVLLGDNGEGKTNIIEAISYLCLTKSFYATSDSLVVNFGADLFEVEGSFTHDHGSTSAVRVAYAQSQNEKTYTINKRHVEPFSSVIGKYPVVICSPEYIPVTTAGPAERRRFVDFVVSQSSQLYFQHLMEYRRVLRHRNKILFDAKISRTNPDTLIEPWNEQLVSLGSSIMCKRYKFIREFSSYVTSAYGHLVGAEEEPGIEYDPSVNVSEDDDEQSIKIALSEKLQGRHFEELRYGTSLVGPHRDELLLKINGLDLRKFASQGQHKTFLVALKIGEFFYLKDYCQETPIMLLDDVFSELDEHRAENLLRFARDLSQVFITSTNPHFFDGVMLFGDRDRKYFIHQGTIVEHQRAEAS
ncbi:MAG TPA: DNA replication and repair protein RecF [Saprospiraceae bacterium]|nr:DNA replication and repair protein RecF [Saprospiraceae bacterium]